MNKRGMELAAGLIITLIICIVVFGIAGALTYRILCVSSDKIDEYSAGQQQALERKMASGPSVIAADASQVAEAPSGICGARGVAGASFAIGIRNDHTAPDTPDILIGVVQFEDSSGIASSTSIQAGDVTYSPVAELRTGQRGIAYVLVNVPSGAAPGRYIIPVEVSLPLSTIPPRTVNLYLTVE